MGDRNWECSYISTTFTYSFCYIRSMIFHKYVHSDLGIPDRRACSQGSFQWSHEEVRWTHQKSTDSLRGIQDCYEFILCTCNFQTHYKNFLFFLSYSMWIRQLTFSWSKPNKKTKTFLILWEVWVSAHDLQSRSGYSRRGNKRKQQHKMPLSAGIGM